MREESPCDALSRFVLPALLAVFAILLTLPAASAQQPLKVGIVTLISGPAAGPFGVPARNAAELTAEMLNAGTVPAPYTQKGFGGRPIELVIIDENGGPQKQVAEFRNLVAARRHRDRLHLERRLPRHRAGRRGAEEAHRAVRLRHAAHLRGRELQIRVPHRADRHDG